eukprot:gnl/MRDRNA2_/MRDRNA2_79345_c0_seq1.p1 gnl/MRDRNA2_/MRDRNA2_79345_c0~~gnl/MRDRNA2_/MRDRNA2_79345_c0_seq1.p1  ORF type:complete len:536 (+),score=155.54 gnl/MRDRNA2_/MRDRNA2_79345_c0_seq1:72-1679(+)
MAKTSGGSCGIRMQRSHSCRARLNSQSSPTTTKSKHLHHTHTNARSYVELVAEFTYGDHVVLCGQKISALQPDQSRSRADTSTKMQRFQRTQISDCRNVVQRHDRQHATDAEPTSARHQDVNTLILSLVRQKEDLSVALEEAKEKLAQNESDHHHVSRQNANTRNELHEVQQEKEAEQEAFLDEVHQLAHMRSECAEEIGLLRANTLLELEAVEEEKSDIRGRAITEMTMQRNKFEETVTQVEKDAREDNMKRTSQEIAEMHSKCAEALNAMGAQIIVADAKKVEAEAKAAAESVLCWEFQDKMKELNAMGAQLAVADGKVEAEAKAAAEFAVLCCKTEYTEELQRLQAALRQEKKLLIVHTQEHQQAEREYAEERAVYFHQRQQTKREHAEETRLMEVQVQRREQVEIEHEQAERKLQQAEREYAEERHMLHEEKNFLKGYTHQHEQAEREYTEELQRLQIALDKEHAHQQAERERSETQRYEHAESARQHQLELQAKLEAHEHAEKECVKYSEECQRLQVQLAEERKKCCVCF